MSIAYMIAHPHVGYLATDAQSQFVHPDGRREIRNCRTKLYTLNGVHAVVAMVGHMEVHHCILGALFNLTDTTFDELADRFADLCNQQFALLRKIASNPDSIDIGNTIMLLGYSEREGRVHGHAFDQKPVDADRKPPQPFAPLLRIPGAFSPSEDGLRTAPWRNDVERIVATAQERAAALREQDDPTQGPTGGPLYLATVTRERITIEKAADLDG